jgi:hypothetical protein
MGTDCARQENISGCNIIAHELCQKGVKIG